MSACQRCERRPATTQHEGPGMILEEVAKGQRSWWTGRAVRRAPTHVGGAADDQDPIVRPDIEHLLQVRCLRGAIGRRRRRRPGGKLPAAHKVARWPDRDPGYQLRLRV